MLKAKNTALVDKIQKERGCARSSARVYASNINRIHRDYLSSTKRSGNLRWLYDHSEKLLAKLKKIENINTQRNLLAAALVGLDMQNAKTKKESYVKQIGALNKKKEEIARAGNLSEKQAAKFISWKEILKLRRLLSRTVRLGNFYSRKVSKREFTIMQQTVVLHLYTEMPPRAQRLVDRAVFDRIGVRGRAQSVKTGQQFPCDGTRRLSRVLGRLQNKKEARNPNECTPQNTPDGAQASYSLPESQFRQ